MHFAEILVYKDAILKSVVGVGIDHGLIFGYNQILITNPKNLMCTQDR